MVEGRAAGGAGRVLAAARRAGSACGICGAGALGARLLLPVVVQKDAALEFAEWRIGEAMVKDAMGVAVPAELRLQAAYPPALLVPCLGFNPQGYRLGYGGGFYDRTLARHEPRPQTLGIAYQCLRAVRQPMWRSTHHHEPRPRINQA
jgi:5,10-methenyltetrahydrofolate synthetase